MAQLPTPRAGSDETTDSGQDSGNAELPELEPEGWQEHDKTLVETRFLTMGARLPALVTQALRLAWRASPVTTVVCIVLNLVSGVATAFGLLATQGAAAALLTEAPTPDRIRAAIPSLLLVGSTLAARSGLSMAAGWAQSRLTPLVTNAVEREFYSATLGMNLVAFDNASLADEMEKSDTRGTSSVVRLVQEAIDVITGVVGVVAVAGALAVIHPLLLALLVLASIPTGWAAVRSARTGYASWHARIGRRRRLMILENLMASRYTAAEVRSLDVGGWLLAEHQKLVALETRADFAVLRSQTWTHLIGGLAAGAAGIGVYIALGWLMTTGAVPLSAGAAAVLAIQSSRGSMNFAIMSVNALFEQGLYAADHDRFMARAATHIPAPRAGRLNEAPSVIRLEKVSLRYPDAEADAVREVSLDIHRGQTIALVGENGSGKTSLAGMLAGLYEPTAGTITWDGHDVTGLDAHQLRDHIAVVTQNYHRWPFTAATNIRIGRTRGGTRPVEDAARSADAHDMITELPRGYDTLLDKQFKSGVDLSGGQWQRLTTARAFYRDAPILICDEPSAALDARAEHTLFEHLRARAGTATTILITHRLANVRHADAIYVLDHGRLIDHGTHDELMARDGVYAELFRLQSKGYADEPITGDRNGR